jgi:hypothetical protein
LRPFAIILTAACACTGAFAGPILPLPAPTYIAQIQSDSAFTTYHNAVSDSRAFASITVSGAAASVSATASGGYNTDWGIATGGITYYIEYTGADGVTLPLRMAVAGDIEVSGSSNALTYGAADIEFDGNQLWSPFCRADFGCTNLSISQTFSFDILSNTQYQVRVSAGANVSKTGDGGAAHAFADPQFSLDPSFANANDFSLAISNGIGNELASSAPEPATFVGAGLALAVFIARRRSRA